MVPGFDWLIEIGSDEGIGSSSFLRDNSADLDKRDLARPDSSVLYVRSWYCDQQVTASFWYQTAIVVDDQLGDRSNIC